MKRKYLIALIVSACVAGVLFLGAALSVGGFSWYGQLQEDNKRRAEAEAAQKAANEAAAARMSIVESNIDQTARRAEQAKAGQKNNAGY